MYKCNTLTPIISTVYFVFRMTKDILKDICKKNNLYIVPKHNDVLYLHFKGINYKENNKIFKLPILYYSHIGYR